MKLEFNSADIQHPNSDATIYEVACELENRYHLLELFFKEIESDLIEYILNQLSSGRFHKQSINDWIKNRWREWILDKGHHITTQASKERGNQPFVDTGSYYLSIQPELVIDSKELKLIQNMIK